MKFKKALFGIIAWLTVLCLCVGFAACNDSSEATSSSTSSEGQSSPGGLTSPGEGLEGGGFVNPGDNWGGGGTGTLPTQVEPLRTDGISQSDLTELSQDVVSTDAIIVDGSEDPFTITDAGQYILKGEFQSGVVVDVADGETTHLFLDGASLSNANGVALSNANKKSDLIVTLVSGSQNTVSNAGDDVNAIHVKGNLKINGTGSLRVTSQSKSAIKVSKALVIVDANVTVEAQSHGFSARSVEAQNATLTVDEAAKDGVNAECDDDTTEFPSGYTEGYVVFKNVDYSANVKGDGIQADTLVYIDGSLVKVTTTGEFVSYSEANMTTHGLEIDDFRYVASGKSYKKVASDSNNSTSKLYALAQSCKGIKVGEIKYNDVDGNEVVMTDGDYLIVIMGDAQINIHSTDDAVHANSGNVLVESGDVALNSYDDGITADKLVQIDGGNIIIESSYEGIEGAYVKITGGVIDVTSSDDGINAASDDKSIKEYIVIDGGAITVDASGDGLDSNGSILITGGTLIVYGSTGNGDGALDAETGIIVEGGTVAALGSLGMVETPSTNSTQYVLSYAQNSTIQAGETLYVKDVSGNVVMAVAVQKNCQSVILSSPDFENGTTYTLAHETGNLATFTISSIITSVGSQGFGPGGMQPGGQPGGGQGGMRPGGQPGGGHGGQNPPTKP
mgnify:CR=1 FL=1